MEALGTAGAAEAAGTAGPVYPWALISTADVAELTQVQRSVVSVWKSRYHGTESAFPSPALTVGNADYFKITDIVQWLEATGLGNNSSASQEAFAYANFEFLLGTERASTLIEAALVLRAQVAAPLVANSDLLLSDSDTHDPDDTHLFTEVQRFAQLREQLSAGVDVVNTIFDQSFSLAHALKILAHRERRRDLESRRMAGSQSLSAFATQVLMALSRDDLDALQFVDVDSAHCDVVEHLLAHEDFLASAPGLLHRYPFVPRPDKPQQSRQTLRRLIAHGLSPRVLPNFDDAALSTVSSFCFISPGTHTTHAEDLLCARLPDIAESATSHTGLVIGPRDLLLGAISDSVERTRSQLIRSGHLRCLALLPEGLFPSHHREQLALWVLSSPADRPQPNQPVYLADLSGVDFDAGKQGFVADIVGAVNASTSRAYAYFSASPINRVAAAQTVDLPVARPQLQQVSAAYDAVALQQTWEQNFAAPLLPGVAISPITPQAVQPRQQPAGAAQWSVFRAQQSALLAIKSGNTIEREYKQRAAPHELGTRVITREVLHVLAANQHLSPPGVSLEVVTSLVLGQLPQLRLTKPGDLVFFQHGGSRAAWVDVHGGHLVQQPARVIRPRSQRIRSALLAKDINGHQHHPHAWKKWTITVLPEQVARETGKVLDHIELARSQLLAQVAALDDLEQVTGGTVARGGVRVALVS